MRAPGLFTLVSGSTSLAGLSAPSRSRAGRSSVRSRPRRSSPLRSRPPFALRARGAIELVVLQCVRGVRLVLFSRRRSRSAPEIISDPSNAVIGVCPRHVLVGSPCSLAWARPGSGGANTGTGSRLGLHFRRSPTTSRASCGQRGRHPARSAPAAGIRQHRRAMHSATGWVAPRLAKLARTSGWCVSARSFDSPSPP